MRGARLGEFDDESFCFLGIGTSEQNVYRILLEHEAAGAQRVADTLGIGLRAAQKDLSSLHAKGLLTRQPGDPPCYSLVASDLAIDALVARRQNQLARARLLAQYLKQRTKERERPETRSGHAIEILTGRDVQSRVFEQLQHAARREVRGIERPPYVNVAADTNWAQMEAMQRGVVYRIIVDSSILEVPAILDRLFDYMRAGELTRVFPGVPLKLMIFDGSAALLQWHREQSDHALLVRSSTLLGPLNQLFELMWEHAAPMSFDAEGVMHAQPHAGHPHPDCDKMLALLAAGINDKAIAHNLGISARTLDRRIVELMKNLGARNRFQAGWLAALRVRQRDHEAPSTACVAAERAIG